MKSPRILLSIVAAVTMTFGLSTSSAYADCPADLNGDLSVNGTDLATLLSAWGTNGASGGTDINGDGTVNGADLALLLGHWGPCGFGGPSSGITLEIDPSKLQSLTGCSAWVVGFANVQGGCISSPTTTNCYNFEALTLTSVPGQPIFASFQPIVPAIVTSPSNFPLHMIKIFGAGVSGKTTITTGISILSGGQLQIFVSPTDTAPTALSWSSAIAPVVPQTGPAQCVSVKQMPSPPYKLNQSTGGIVPFDLVEFTYIPNPTHIPNTNSAFDLTAVNGLVVPMTMTPPAGHPDLGPIGIQTDILREDIGTAYTHFMTQDPYGDPFKQLLYHTSVDNCYSVPPPTPRNQFFAIASPGYWTANNTDMDCVANTNLKTYWDAALGFFFTEGNNLKLYFGGTTAVPGTTVVVPTEYTGTCAMDTASGVCTYTFKGPLGHDVMNIPTGLKLKLPKPNSSQSASFVFSNSLAYPGCSTNCYFPNGAGPGGDGGLIIDAIMEALNRGVARDGLNLTPITISSATSIFVLGPTTSPNPMGLATITTALPHGIPIDLPTTMNPCKVNILGFPGNSPPIAASYNGSQPISPLLLHVVDDTTFKFQYNIDQLQVNHPNTTNICLVTPGSYNPVTNTTSAVVSWEIVGNPNMPITVGEVVYLIVTSDRTLDGPYTVTTVGGIPTSCGPGLSSGAFEIEIPGNHASQANGGTVWRGLLAPGACSPSTTVTPVGTSSIAWNNFENWYGAPTNPSHQTQAYNTYAKFLHYSTIGGTDSRLGGVPIFINNQAYGFPYDENPNGPYTGPDVPSKFEGTIPDGSTINLTLSPWVVTTP